MKTLLPLFCSIILCVNVNAQKTIPFYTVDRDDYNLTDIKTSQRRIDTMNIDQDYKCVVEVYDRYRKEIIDAQGLYNTSMPTNQQIKNIINTGVQNLYRNTQFSMLNRRKPSQASNEDVAEFMSELLAPVLYTAEMYYWFENTSDSPTQDHHKISEYKSLEIYYPFDIAQTRIVKPQSGIKTHLVRIAYEIDYGNGKKEAHNDIVVASTEVYNRGYITNIVAAVNKEGKVVRYLYAY